MNFKKIISFLKTGFSFGLTSGVITTLGLIVSLHAGTESKKVVIGGILAIAVADAFSDALGIHISEEAENNHSQKEVWISTFTTFLSKFLFALSFLLPINLWDFPLAIYMSIGWGLVLLGIFSFYLGKQQKVNPWGIISEHLLIALVVIMITHYIGDWINKNF